VGVLLTNKYPTFLLKEVQEIKATKGWLSNSYNLPRIYEFFSVCLLTATKAATQTIIVTIAKIARTAGITPPMMAVLEEGLLGNENA